MIESTFSRCARNLFPYVISICVCFQFLVILYVTDMRTTLHPRKDDMISQELRMEAAPLPPSTLNYSIRDPDVETHVTVDFRDKCHSGVNLIRGYPKSQKGFLTLGISTVPRMNAFYLLDTLKSLISEMTEMDKNVCRIVVLMATYNSTWVNQTLKLIDEEFNSSIASGLLQVIQPKTGVYPDLTNITRRTYDDPLERVQWRSKQNVDFSLLFAYCANISKYYIHLEDDVYAATAYISDIKTYMNLVDRTNTYWFVLEFSNLGFIGKLFRSSDLCMMSNYFYLFLEDKPCDYLFVDLKRIKLQTKAFRSKIALFQHFGFSSSLDGKIQNLTDTNFKKINANKEMMKHHDHQPAFVRHLRHKTRGFIVKPKNGNPDAKILTNMREYLNFKAECAYIGQDCVFWTEECTKGNYYRLLFDTPIQLYNVSIFTGHPVERTDILINGTVTIGTKTDCNVTHLGDFKNGILEVKMEEAIYAACLQITLLESQETWIVISDILINKKG